MSGQPVDLVVGGMTCASCAARVEKRLNRLPGVVATVNYATGRASVDLPAGTTVDEAVAAVTAAGYTAAAPRATDEVADDADLRRLRARLVVAALLTLPVVAMAMVPAARPPAWELLSLALAAPVVAWAGWPFHRTALAGARHGTATMDTLVSLGTLAAAGWSLFAVVAPAAGGGREPYLEVATAVTTLVLAGRWVEGRSRRRSGAALRALMALGARTATVLRDGEEVPVDPAALAVGDLLVVRPGEAVAADGTVVEGTSAVDASTLTGEPVPVEVGPGASVAGGTVNAGGRLLVRATRVGADTQLAQTARLVERAQSGKAPVQRLADRVSGVFVPVVIVLAAATLGGWLLAGAGAQAAVTAAVAVLIIACPCALGLATPTALLVGTGRGAQLGVIIRGPEVLELSRSVDTVVLDKTGTVTTGVMALVGAHPADGTDEVELLAVAGALEHASDHPVARAVAEGARARLGRLDPVTDVASTGGLGITGTVGGRAVVAGRSTWLAERWGMPLDAGLRAALVAAERAGRTVVVVGWDGAARGLLVTADEPRATSADAVAHLHRLGLSTVLLTGDNARAARAVADRVGVDEVVAEVLPAGKVEAVAALQRAGRVVAVVGDGVNDAAALAQADLGVAMGSGSDVAIEASDLTLVRPDLLAAVDALRLSRRTLRTIRANLFWAFAYNVAALPLAAAGLLSPVVAGAAMALSSVFVVTNSLRLRRFTAVA